MPQKKKIVVFAINFMYSPTGTILLKKITHIFFVSGVPHTEQPSVASIESTCHQGELHWTNPYGGLRITFNPRMNVYADFKLCFTARHPGVMIYKEDFKGLTLLSSDSETTTKRAICIKNKSGQIPVLYLETQQNQTLTQVNYTVLVNGRKRPRHLRIRGKILESMSGRGFTTEHRLS